MTSRLEEIRNRKLSKTGQAALDALAERAGDKDDPAAKAIPEPAPAPAEGKEPKSIEDLVNHYHKAFSGNANLVIAAMQLEGAALIAKAIKDASK